MRNSLVEVWTFYYSNNYSMYEFVKYSSGVILTVSKF